MKKQFSLFLFVALIVGCMFVFPSCTITSNVTGAKTYASNIDTYMNCEFTYDPSDSSFEFTLNMSETCYSKTKMVARGIKNQETTTITSITVDTEMFGQVVETISGNIDDDIQMFVESFVNSLVIEGEYAAFMLGLENSLIPITLKTADFKKSVNNELLSIKGPERFQGNNYDISIPLNSTQDDLIATTNYFMFYKNGHVRAEGSFFQGPDYQRSIVLIEGIDYTETGNYNVTYKFIGGGEINLVVNVSEENNEDDRELDCYLPSYVEQGTTLANYLNENTPMVRIENSGEVFEPITEEMITGFNTDSVGIITVTVTYQEISKEIKLMVYDSENLTVIDDYNERMYSVLKDTEKANLDILLGYVLSDGSYESVNINDETVTLTGYNENEAGIQVVTLEYMDYSFNAIFYVHETDDNPVIDATFYNYYTDEAVGNVLMVPIDSEGNYDISDYGFELIKMDGPEITEIFSLTDIEGFDAENLKVVYYENWAWFNYCFDVDEFMYTIEKTFTVGDYSYTANFYVIFMEYLY